MLTQQEQYDDAMFDFSTADYDSAIAKFNAILAEDPAHFDAQLALGMAYCRKGDYATAIAEGHKAEQLRPNEQLVHTNLSLFYMKAGDKKTAEHHGLQARIASWRANPARLRHAIGTFPRRWDKRSIRPFSWFASKQGARSRLRGSGRA